MICLDATTIRTADGVVYPTPSDLDMIEGKVLAVLNRAFIEHRDFVDLFLFGDRLTTDSPRRLQEKLSRLGVAAATIRKRLGDFKQNGEYHSRSVQAVIDTQFDPVAAAQINSGGGGKAVFGRAQELILANVRV